MLYDILIIDDDFSEESDSENQDDDFSKKPDSENLGNNANKLLCDLIRENLRVTWTTGKITDAKTGNIGGLEKLSGKDLSTIKFIFLDLHLQGFNQDHNFKITAINGNIMSIFGKINSHIKSQNVTCYINSKYSNHKSGYGDKGKNDLEKKLMAKFKEKYSLEVVETKNALSDTQKDNLIKNNFAVYCKSLIINKAIEVEKIFDDKLQIAQELRDVITFENKHKKLQDKFKNKLFSNNKTRIQLLQQIRNKLAHTEGDLSAIRGKDLKKTFWKIISDQGDDKPIEFEDFASLMKYIISIDDLCESLNKII